MDAVSSERIAELHPSLIVAAKQLDQNMDARGISFRVTQGLRSWTEQAAIYAQGRTAPGQIVTNAPPGYSWHQFGMAFDFVPLVNSEPDWTLAHPSWVIIRDAGEALGLVSGSRWTHPDFPHFQLTGRFPATPDDEVRYIFREGGVQAVWDAASIL